MGGVFVTRKVLLVGTGNIARTHAAVLKQSPGVQLDGVFDTSRAAAESFASEFGARSVFASLGEAAASDATRSDAGDLRDRCERVRRRTAPGRRIAPRTFPAAVPAAWG